MYPAKRKPQFASNRVKSVAIAFVIAIATTYSSANSVPAGIGTLSYTTNTVTEQCTIRLHRQGTFLNTGYSNFSYTDPSGTTYFSAGADSISQSPGSNGTIDCPDDGGDPVTFTTPYATIVFTPQGAGSGSATVSYVSGHINPKYVILGVTFAPPGAQSFVQYTNSTLVGNTSSFSESYASQVSQSVSLSGTTGTPHILGISSAVTVTGSESTAYIQESNDSSSVSVTKQTTISDKTPGPADSFLGVDHDYDLIWVWLNPLIVYSVPCANALQWNGYAYDMTDQPAMDVISIPVGYLNGHFGAMPPDISTPIARSWATGQIWPAGEGPALTATDLANILGADPWGANPSYTVSIAAGSNPPTTTDGRFTIVNGTGSTQAFLYQQAPPGGQPSTQSYQEQNTSSSTFGTGGKYTIQQAWGLEERFSGSFFWQSVQYDFKQSQTLTWTTQRNNTTTDTSTETNMLSITGPTCTGNPCTPLYTGPSQFDVYQDNLYGTFMFWGVN